MAIRCEMKGTLRTLGQESKPFLIKVDSFGLMHRHAKYTQAESVFGNVGQVVHITDI